MRQVVVISIFQIWKSNARIRKDIYTNAGNATTVILDKAKIQHF
jgi:hypothetical protein